MKSERQILRGVPFLILAWNMLPMLAHAQFTQQGPKLVGTDTVGSALEGYSVSLSGDGSTAILGGPGDNGGLGAAWVFTRSSRVWRQQAKLPGTVIAAGAAGQGSSVSISHDGDTALVGRPGDGTAWVYTQAEGAWSQQAMLVPPTSHEGLSVSLSGDGNTALVGMPGDSNIGAAYVFVHSGGAWSQQAKLVGTGADLVDGVPAFQGFSVSLSFDGSTAIVGGSTDDNEVGAAWVFTRSNGVWSQQGPKLVGTGGAAPSEQGYSVSLSGDGNTAIVGGPLDNSSTGAAWVYTRKGGSWKEQAKLVGVGAVNAAEQGASVSLSGNGNTATVGGPDDNSGAGAIWLYARTRTTWTQEAKLVGTGAVTPPGATQGWSVSVSSDGSTAAVGGPQDASNTGAAWIFARPVLAGTPGMADCLGTSISALAEQYGGLNNAAADLGYSSVSALQNAVITFCRG